MSEQTQESNKLIAEKYRNRCGIVPIRAGNTYRVRGFRHFMLDAYKCDNPLIMMGRNDRIGKMETGDRCKVLVISGNYTQVLVKKEELWVHTHSFRCSINRQ